MISAVTGRPLRVWHRFPTGGLGALILCLLAGVTAFAQTDRDPHAPNPLVIRQEMIRDRLDRLTDRMFSLHQKLRESDPESAALLAAGLERLGELDVEGQVNELISWLADGALLDKAGERQQHLLGDLQTLLAALAEPPTDAEALQKELRRLKAISKEMGRILDEQRRELQETKQITARAHAAQLLQAAIEQAQALEDAQAELLEQTETPPSEPTDADQKRAASKQRQLAEQAQRLADELPTLDDDIDAPAETTDNVESASASMQSAADAMGSAADAMTASDSQESSGASSGESSESPSSEAIDADIDANRPEATAEKQQDALDELRRAIHRLEQARDALNEEADAQKQANDQRKLADQTKSLEQRMDDPSQPQPGQGQQKAPNGTDQEKTPGEGQSPSGEGKSGKSSSGAESLGRAQQHMERAAEELDDEDLSEGADEQADAVEALEQAKQEVDDALRQLREKEREELLGDLQTRLVIMLQQQLAINGATLDLDAIGRPQFTRVEDLRIAELVASQLEVAAASDACLRILEEDGTSIVLPRMLQRVAADMRTVADRLAGSDVGPLTRLVQEHITATLADLVQAVQQQRDEMAEDSAGGGSSSDEDSPLLPTSAELKMLRAAQVRLHEQTQAVAEVVEVNPDVTEVGDLSVSVILNEIASHQTELAAAAREMRDRAEGR